MRASFDWTSAARAQHPRSLGGIEEIGIELVSMRFGETVGDQEVQLVVLGVDAERPAAEERRGPPWAPFLVEDFCEVPGRGP